MFGVWCQKSIANNTASMYDVCRIHTFYHLKRTNKHKMSCKHVRTSHGNDVGKSNLSFEALHHNDPDESWLNSVSGFVVKNGGEIILLFGSLKPAMDCIQAWNL